MKRALIVVRGGGDLATGVIQKLYRSGFGVVVLESEKPSAIRRRVCLSEAVYDGRAQVEDLTAVLVASPEKALEHLDGGPIPLLTDPAGDSIDVLKPAAVVDAIMAKRNLGTNRAMAPITIGLGPGFTAPVDVDCVVETMRGHDLGRLIFSGTALADTGVPGKIQGYGKERVIHSPTRGIINNLAAIGDIVEAGQVIASVDNTPVTASLDGVLRGLIRQGYDVKKGMKIADIDPRREEYENYLTISDKARCLGGAVLEAIMMLTERNGF